MRWVGYGLYLTYSRRTWLRRMHQTTNPYQQTHSHSQVLEIVRASAATEVDKAKHRRRSKEQTRGTDNSSVPVLVDAGIGCASDASKAMELGCDGVLMNSAIANANDPLLMASAMKHAIIAGRESYLAGRMMKKAFASASSPMENLI